MNCAPMTRSTKSPFLSWNASGWAALGSGAILRRRLTCAAPNPPPPEVFTFYRCHRASLRARLAVAHLFEKEVRTSEKWPAQARSYLRLVAADAQRLDAQKTSRSTRPRRACNRPMISASSGATGSTSILSRAAAESSRKAGTAGFHPPKGNEYTTLSDAFPGRNVSRHQWSGCTCPTRSQSEVADRWERRSQGRNGAEA